VCSVHAVDKAPSLSSCRFEIAIFVLIFLNMLTMGIEHYNQPHAVFFVLEVSNAFFTTVFGLGKCITFLSLQVTEVSPELIWISGIPQIQVSIWWNDAFVINAAMEMA
jgi:hypothetical protein